MTEHDWLAASSPRWMYDCLLATGQEPSLRKLRLFYVACLRSNRYYTLAADRTRCIVEAVERFVDGREDDLCAVRNDANALSDLAFDELRTPNAQELRRIRGEPLFADDVADHGLLERVAFARTTLDKLEATFFVASDLVELVSLISGPMPPTWMGWTDLAEEESEQRYLLESRLDAGLGNLRQGAEPAAVFRDLFENPFRPVAAPASSWRTSSVNAIAELIYENHRFNELPLLADAVEQAGCQDSDMTSHCRSDLPHARGCWVLDLILENR